MNIVPLQWFSICTFHTLFIWNEEQFVPLLVFRSLSFLLSLDDWMIWLFQLVYFKMFAILTHKYWYYENSNAILLRIFFNVIWYPNFINWNFPTKLLLCQCFIAFGYDFETNEIYLIFFLLKLFSFNWDSQFGKLFTYGLDHRFSLRLKLYIKLMKATLLFYIKKKHDAYLYCIFISELFQQFS